MMSTAIGQLRSWSLQYIYLPTWPTHLTDLHTTYSQYQYYPDYHQNLTPPTMCLWLQASALHFDLYLLVRVPALRNSMQILYYFRSVRRASAALYDLLVLTCVFDPRSREATGHLANCPLSAEPFTPCYGVDSIDCLAAMFEHISTWQAL